MKSNQLNQLPRNASDCIGFVDVPNLAAITSIDYSSDKEDEIIDDEEDDDEIYQDSVDKASNKDEVDRNMFDSEKVWASPYSLSFKGRRLFVHYYCAIYSPLVSVSAGRKWFNLRSEVSRGQALQCSLCSKRGPTLGCIVGRCNVVVSVWPEFPGPMTLG